MSSIGRTRLTSSNLLALSVGLTAFSGVALTASQIIENLTQNGPISVNFENLAWWSQADVRTAEVDEVQQAIAASAIEEKAFVASAEKIPTPKALLLPRKLNPVRVAKTAPKRTEKLPVSMSITLAKPASVAQVIENNAVTKVAETAEAEFQLPTVQPILVTDKIRAIQSSDLDEVPGSREPEPKSESMRLGELVSMPSAEEQKAMQDAYAAMTRRFYVAVHQMDLKLKPTLIADQTIDAVPEATPVIEDLSSGSLAAEYAARGATVIEEEIAPPVVPAEATETPAAVVAEEKKDEVPTTQSATVSANRPILVASANLDGMPELEATAESTRPLTTQIKPDAKLDTQIIQPKREDNLDQVPEEATLTTEVAKLEPPKQNAPPDRPVAAKIATKHTPAAPAAVAVLAAPSMDDLSGYEADIAESMNSQPDDLDLADYPVQSIQKSSRKPVSSTSVRSAINATKNGHTPSPALPHGTRIAQHTVQPKASLPYSKKTADVTGVDQDANGITISWTKSAPTREIPSTAELSSIIGDQTDAAKDQIPDPKKLCDTALIGRDAFSPLNSETISVCRRAISLEGSAKGEQSKWWEVRESSGHWPTIIWQGDRDAFQSDRRVPLISNNNVKLLSAIARAQVQSSAGIVFGEIPAGLEIQITGRSEPVVFFDSALKPVANGDVSRARHFAFVNAAPGNPVLLVSQRGGSRSGAIPIVVKPGFSTFVRVPAPVLKTLESRVFDASSRTARGIPSLSVQIIGQEGKTAVTDTRGSFEIRDVVTFGDYPIYVDVAPNEKSFKHRYRIRMNELKGKSLFYFGERMVSHWISQLEGGVSPFSGLVVGAVPSLAQEKSAFVRVGNFDKKASLSPEAYSLGADDSLKSDQKIGNGNVRFLGVQIPEGPNVPTVLNSSGETLWSELVIAQPGVINVVGP